MQNCKFMLALISLTLTMFPFLSSTSFAGTPFIANLSDKVLAADSAAVIFDSDISFSGGDNYVDGFMRFSLAGATPSDQFSNRCGKFYCRQYSE